FFSSRRRHTRFSRDWSSDVCSSDLVAHARQEERQEAGVARSHLVAHALGLGGGLGPVVARLAPVLPELGPQVGPRGVRGRLGEGNTVPQQRGYGHRKRDPGGGLTRNAAVGDGRTWARLGRSGARRHRGSLTPTPARVLAGG